MRRAYSERASELITELAKYDASRRDRSERAADRGAVGGTAGTDRKTLHEDLLELHNAMISVDVSEADHDRDLRLRGALSEAIGAASSLASASHNQPTAAYLRVAKPAIDSVLSAAGSRSSD